MPRLTDEDGIDGPFNRAMDLAMKDDAKAAAKRRPASTSIYLQPETAAILDARDTGHEDDEEDGNGDEGAVRGGG